MHHKASQGPLKNPHVLTGSASHTLIREAYRRLYRKLLNLYEQESMRTFAITSAHIGEGKTLLSINLALTVSEDPSSRVTLVDCDLRMPDVAKYLGISAEEGLGDVLHKKRELKDVTIPAVEGRPNLRLVPAGRFENDISPELYMKRLPPVLEEIKGNSDVLILDTPPILPISDQDFLSDLVDAVFLVVRPAKSRRSLLKEAMESMERKNLRGIVINGITKATGRHYYYRYE